MSRMRARMEVQVGDYEYLWDGTSDGWVLMQVNGDQPDEPPRYAIFNTETKRALLICDDAIYSKVKEAMIANGVRIVRPQGLSRRRG